MKRTNSHKGRKIMVGIHFVLLALRSSTSYMQCQDTKYGHYYLSLSKNFVA